MSSTTFSHLPVDVMGNILRFLPEVRYVPVSKSFRAGVEAVMQMTWAQIAPNSEGQEIALSPLAKRVRALRIPETLSYFGRFAQLYDTQQALARRTANGWRAFAQICQQNRGSYELRRFWLAESCIPTVDVEMDENLVLLWEQAIRPALHKKNLLIGETLPRSAAEIRSWLDDHQEDLNEITELSIFQAQMSAISPEIGKFRQLTDFSCRRTQVWYLPDELGLLNHLKNLHLNDNAFSTVPPLLLSNALGHPFLSTQRGGHVWMSGNPLDLHSLTSKADYNLMRAWLGTCWDTEESYFHASQGGKKVGIASGFSNPPTSLAGVRAWLRSPQSLPARKGIPWLNLSGMALTLLDPDLCHAFPHLTSLNLANNKLKQLPEELEHLISLQKIDLSNNRFEEVPAPLLKVPGFANAPLNAIKVDLRQNKITRVSNDVYEHFEGQLALDFDELEAFPPDMITLNERFNAAHAAWQQHRFFNLDLRGLGLAHLEPRFCTLLNLHSMDLSNNALTELPPQMDRLTQLAKLDLRNNQFEHVPLLPLDLWGTWWNSSTRLDLRNNPIRSISQEAYQRYGDTLRVSWETLEEVPIEMYLASYLDIRPMRFFFSLFDSLCDPFSNCVREILSPGSCLAYIPAFIVWLPLFTLTLALRILQIAIDLPLYLLSSAFIFIVSKIRGALGFDPQVQLAE